MRKAKLKKLIIVSLIVATICASVIALLSATQQTYSAFTSVFVPRGNEVTVYVSGNDVKMTDDGYYTAPIGETIAVTVVNEKKLFKSMTINGESFDKPVQEITVPMSGDVVITVETDDPYAEDKGKYFGNPFILNKEADVLAVARILANRTCEADFRLLGVTDWDYNAVRYGYFRLGTNLFISDDEFFGLGFRGNGGLPFGGCFDFDGYVVTINLVRTSHVTSEFAYDNSIHVADYGFFSYAYGDGINPCLIRNAKMQGFIGINTVDHYEESDHSYRINIGGLSATLGKNVVLDGIESSVSVGAQTNYAELYLGGIFGFCSSSVESWCDVRYDGSFNDISGVTYGKNAKVVAGTFAGVIYNASVDGVTVDAERSLVVANSLGEISGSAIAGGFAGVIQLGSTVKNNLSQPRPMIIRNVDVFAEQNFSVSAVINNSDSTKKDKIDSDNFSVNSQGAVAGGIIGIVNRENKNSYTLAENHTITFTKINFLRTSTNTESNVSSNSEQGRLLIHASTQDGDSSGAVFAGGVVGYIYSDGGNYIKRVIPDDVDTKYYFNCSVDISAIQNGIGPAYAGGAFGYNAFHTDSYSGRTLKLAIVAPQYDYSVTACQSATSKKTGNIYYDVCAGGYSSRFCTGYDVTDVVFYIGNGKIKAFREVGSTAIGDINAGGCAGRLLGCNKPNIDAYDANSSQSGIIDNLTVYYSSGSRIEAGCFSYDSINTNTNNSKTSLGNNVCSGGVFGYVLGYSSINNVSLNYLENTSSTASEFFVCGTQNGANVSGHDYDLKTEGCIGGMFGLVIDTKISAVELFGDPSENSVVYFTSSNSPNTASVGGLIGVINNRRRLSRNTPIDEYMLDNASIKNVHVAGKAYCNKKNDKDVYDIYVGGAIGVMANPREGNFSVNNVKVDNCIIDAVGENTMLPYAGGAVAGMWWSSTTRLSNTIVSHSSVTSSSIKPCAYAGGIAGLIQKSELSYCLTQDTEVKAVSFRSSAYAGGIASRAKENGDAIKYCYSNASLKAQGKNVESSFKFGIVALIVNKYNIGYTTGDVRKNFFVNETAGTVYGFNGDTDSSALYFTLNQTDYDNKLSLSINESKSIFPSITVAQNGITMSVISHDTSVARINGLTVEGVSRGIAYVGAYCKINNQDYFLCSYAVTVDGATENSNGLNLVTDDGLNVSEQNTDGYAEYVDATGTTTTNYTYFRRNVGNPNTVRKVNVVPINAEYLPQTVNFYDITLPNDKAEYFTDDTTENDKRTRIATFIASKGNSCDISAFNGRANVGFNYATDTNEGGAKKSVYFYVNDNMRDPTIILMECVYGENTYGVIIEFIPNKLVELTIVPESGTAPLGSFVAYDGKANVTHYIYNVGEVIRFGCTLTYRYPAPRSYVVETIYSGNGVTENGVLVVNSIGEYKVYCQDLRGNVKKTYVIVQAKEEIAVSFTFSGAKIAFDRKMVDECDYEFTVQPQPGYGLNPQISATVNGTTCVAQFTSNGFVLNFGTDSFTFPYTRLEFQYSFAVTVQTDFVNYVQSNGNSVEFNIQYNKTYSLVFISNFNDNDFFSTTVTSGVSFSVVTPQGFQEWANSLIHSRYGYDFRGFYTLSSASDVSAYGKSFEDMQNDGVSIVSGTMRFYARWTHSVTLDVPSNVTISSTLPESMLHDGEIIPLDANCGFGFVIQTNDEWIGKPTYKSFVRLKSGEYTDITSLFVPSNGQNGYFVSYQDLEGLESGHICITVFSDSLEFAIGDEQKYDGNSLYTYGIFTVTYNANYGINDNPVDFSFDFAHLGLPSGTSVRLFYQKDGLAIWAGKYNVTAYTTSLFVSNFSALNDDSPLSMSLRNNATSEKFILVVTLPENTNEFAINSATNVTVGVESYRYQKAHSFFGDASPFVLESPNTSDNKAECQFTLYPAVIRSVLVSGNVIEYTESGTLAHDVTDHRHNGISYMWRIEKTSGGYIGDVSFVGLGEQLLRATDAIYYTANVGSITISGDLTGYSISLIAVKNIQQPSASVVIFRHDF